MVEKKLFFYKFKAPISCIPRHDCCADYKKSGDLHENHKENGEKKSFSCQIKASISCTPRGEHDCSANNKKNEDYFKYPSLYHSTDQL